MGTSDIGNIRIIDTRTKTITSIYYKNKFNADLRVRSQKASDSQLDQ